MEALSGQTRVRPTYVQDERELLERWLDFHRDTLLAKCEGLSDKERNDRPVESSLMSLHGLVRHMAEVERNWFQRILLGRADATRIWSDPDIPGSPFVPLDECDWAGDLEIWQNECAASREAGATRALDDTGTWREKQVSLRSIYLHMIQEYARHNGHADLLRELEDGAVGL